MNKTMNEEMRKQNEIVKRRKGRGGGGVCRRVSESKKHEIEIKSGKRHILSEFYLLTAHYDVSYLVIFSCVLIP